MLPPQPGERAPDFTLEGPTGPVTLTDLLGAAPLILLFFQEANTPACDTQLRAFVNEQELIGELGARVMAVSTDPADAQRRFAGTLGAPFPILTDTDGGAARAYGVLDEASGRAQRAVFVISPDGVVMHAQPWYNPANSSQFEEVFAALGLEPGAGF
jgi:peroxiredoxin